jgi:PAS domain S-box-containing protein
MHPQPTPDTAISRFRTAFEHAPAGMVLFDPDSLEVLEANSAAVEVLGGPEIPKSILQGESGERQATRPDGQSIWLDVRLSRTGVCQFHDITARRRAHEDLRQSEERLSTMLQTTHEGVWILGPDDLTTFANARMAEMLGCRVEEMIGRPVTDFVAPEDEQSALARLAGRRRGVSDQFEIRWRSLDGREVWTILNASPLTDAEGHYAGACAMVTDITDRMLHERAVRASEERYRNIIETTTEGVWMIDGDHRTTYVNRRMAEMLGYGVEEMLGRPVRDFMTDGSADLPAGRPREVSYRRKDGSEMWGLLSGSPLTDDSGGYGGALAMVADITDRKRSEESVARLAAIVEASPDGIFSTDTDARITSWNAAAERIYGYSEEEMLGESCRLLVLPEREDEAHEVARTMLSGGSMVNFVSQARTKDGRTIDIAPSVSAIKSASGEVVGTLTIVRQVEPSG